MPVVIIEQNKNMQDIPIIILRLPPTALTLAAGKHAKIVITKSNWRWHVNTSSLKKINGSLVKMKEEEQQENIMGKVKSNSSPLERKT